MTSNKHQFLVLSIITIIFLSVVFMVYKNASLTSNSATDIQPSQENEVADSSNLVEFSGTVMSLGQSGDYLRILTGDGKIVSAGINNDSRIIEDGLSAGLMSVQPMDHVSVAAQLAQATNQYDYIIDQLIILDSKVDTDADIETITPTSDSKTWNFNAN